MSARVILIVDASQEALLRAAFMGAGFAVRVPTPDESTLDRWIALARSGEAALFVIDPRRLNTVNVSLAAAAAAIRLQIPDAAAAASFSDRERPLPLTHNWAIRHGLLGAFGRVSKAQLAQSAEALLEAATRRIGASWQPERVQQFARALLTVDTDANLTPTAMSDEFVDRLADSILEECLALGDRRWRLKSYPSCFVGIDAVSQMARKLGTDRAAATAFGQRLLERGYIYHVTGDQPFRDGNFYYRVHQITDRLKRVDIDQIELHLRKRVAIADRTWRGLSFPRCFVGSDARQILMREVDLGFAEAVTLGQALLETHAFRHVADAHDFFGTDYFYRFVPEVYA